MAIMIFHIPQSCSLQKSLCKFCWPICKQKRTQWPTQPRNLFCLIPLKTPLRMQNKSLVFLQQHYKKACLKPQNYAHTNRDTRARTHTELGSKNLIRYIVGGAREKAGKRGYGEIWSAKDVGMLQYGMEVVLGLYKKGGGQAERMINPGY